MSETAKQETVRRTVLPGNVVLFNSHLVHPTLMDIIEMALDEEKDHSLKAIFFSEKKSVKDDYGWYIPEMDVIVMNLPNCLEKTIKAMQENETGLSIAAAIWVNMIWTFFHELHHAIAWTIDAETCEAEREGQEEEAEAYAEEMLNIVADGEKVEGPALEELPWFKEHAVKALAVTDRKFMEKQAEMMEKGLIFNHAGVEHTSMKEYFKDASGAVTEMENDAVVLELAPDGELTQVKVEDLNLNAKDVQTFQPPAKAQPMEQLEMFMGQEGTCYDIPDENGQEVQEEPQAQVPGSKVAAGALTNGTPRDAAIKMWLLLYNHIFENNGFNGISYAHGRVTDNPVPIPADVAAHGFITGSRNNNGVWVQADVGYVVGRYFKDGLLPGYDIGVLDGQTRKVFRLIAQNPKTGSTYAQRALKGAKIAWLIDTSTNSWIAKIDNGKYERV